MISGGASEQKRWWEAKKPDASTFLAWLNNKHYTLFSVFIMHAITSLLYISIIYASQYKYKSMVGESTHSQIISHQSTQNAANLLLQTYEKNQWTFLLYNTGVDSNSRYNFANLSFFAKVQSIIPCKYALHCCSCLLLEIPHSHRKMQLQLSLIQICILVK